MRQLLEGSVSRLPKCRLCGRRERSESLPMRQPGCGDWSFSCSPWRRMRWPIFIAMTPATRSCVSSAARYSFAWGWIDPKIRRSLLDTASHLDNTSLQVDFADARGVRPHASAKQEGGNHAT
jgi:hypothetical protein